MINSTSLNNCYYLQIIAAIMPQLALANQNNTDVGSLLLMKTLL